MPLHFNWTDALVISLFALMLLSPCLVAANCIHEPKR